MSSNITSRGRYAALIAAILGWLFDGFEMGLFPVISRPALMDLLDIVGTPTKAQNDLIAMWNGLAIAGFLIGAATGGVLFGWLGDKLGRVRAMSLSILTYALCSGLGAFTTHPWQMVVVRFIAALGMGGEWSLGVALVMELWGGKSRALLAGLIGSAANLGFALVALLSFAITKIKVTGQFAEWAGRDAWRLLMIAGMAPAVITFFIRLFVPESERWQQEKKSGSTSSWATRDMIGVLVGAFGAMFVLMLWTPLFVVALPVRLVGTVVALIVVTGGFLYPIQSYLRRSNAAPEYSKKTLYCLAIGAGLSGIALLGTWGSIQWATTWVAELPGAPGTAKQWTQFFSAMGAVCSALVAPFVCELLGRRVTYVVLCLAALGFTFLFYQGGTSYGIWFLARVFLAGAFTATFYGWLPMYLPELFPTRVRATGQGFSYNFGRVIAAIGALQTGVLTGYFKEVEVAPWLEKGIPTACCILSLVYLVGVGLIWLAPETKGKPLPE
jgi:MFS family permease